MMMNNQLFNSSAFEQELVRILNFWETKMIDHEHGGFLGRIDFRNEADLESPKGLVLNARILWTFSRAAFILKSDTCKQSAQRAYYYLVSRFSDPVYGGMYWMLDVQGKPLITKKQIYAQAFAIYGLSEFYQLTGEPKALEMALGLFNLIEKYSFDREKNGYLEAFDREWNLLEDLRLSEKDANEVKTMNTHLHVLEAYSNLYKVAANDRIARQLHNLILLFTDRFLDPESGQYRLFFDENWQLKSDEISYGHDIETAWLLQEAAETLGDPELVSKTARLAVQTARATLPFFDDDGGLLNAGIPGGITDRGKHWWPQAEALVGLYNAYQVSGEERFRAQAVRSWDFIRNQLLDIERGEWVWGVKKDGAVMQEDKAGPWKCPYHNGRAMMEMIKRIPAER